MLRRGLIIMYGLMQYVFLICTCTCAPITASRESVKKEDLVNGAFQFSYAHTPPPPPIITIQTF